MSNYNQQGSKTGRDQFNAAGDININKNEPNWELFCPSKGKCPGVIALDGKMPECYLEFSGGFIKAKKDIRTKIIEVFYEANNVKQVSEKMKTGNFLESLLGAVSGLGIINSLQEYVTNGTFELYKCPFCESFILYEKRKQSDGTITRERVGELKANK